MRSGIGAVVVKYVISPHGWETLVSGRETGKGAVGIGSMGAWGSTVGGDEVGRMSVWTSWGSRNEGFRRAVAATATEMLEASGSTSPGGSRAWRRSSGESSEVGDATCTATVPAENEGLVSQTAVIKKKRMETSKNSNLERQLGLTLLFLDAGACLRAALISLGRVLQRKLLLQLQAIGHEAAAIGRIGSVWSLLASTVLVEIDLARCLGQRLESTPSSLWRRKLGGRLAIDTDGDPAVRLALNSCSGGDAVELETGAHAVGIGDGRAFLGDVRRQAVDAALGEVLAALLARVRIAVAVVVELWPAHKVLEDEGVRLAAHCAGLAVRFGAIGDARLGAEGPGRLDGGRLAVGGDAVAGGWQKRRNTSSAAVLTWASWILPALSTKYFQTACRWQSGMQEKKEGLQGDYAHTDGQ